MARNRPQKSRYPATALITNKIPAVKAATMAATVAALKREKLNKIRAVAR